MPSSQTTNLRLVLPVQGELAGAWGNTVNTGLTSLVDDAVAGTGTVSVGALDITLSTANGAADQARYAVLYLTAGGSVGARNIIVPAVSKLYVVRNATGYAQTVKTAAGAGVSVPDGRLMFLYCDGTDVLQAITGLDSPAFTGTPTAPTAATGTNTTQIATTAHVFAERSATATLSGKSLATLGVVSFVSPTSTGATTGTININWSTAQNYTQAEPTGTITYTFTAPAGPCHLQLFVNSDGTSAAQTFNWPGTVIWMGYTWAATDNKKAVISFWYDGTNYYATGVNQV